MDRTSKESKAKDAFEPEAPKTAKSSKRIGTFLPMPVNQMRHELLDPVKRRELTLPTFRADALTTKDASGRVMQFTKPQGGIIQAYGLPTNMLLEFRVLSKPCSLVRDVTLSTIEKLETASSKSSVETRAVITGLTGSGKSYLLLQAVEYCKSKDWIVLYVPRAINLVNSSTEYVYDARTRTYLQPEFSFQLLQRFQQVNARFLGALQLTKQFNIGRRALPIGTPINELLNVAQRDKALSPFVLETLLKEVSRQKTHPVLLAVDDFQALYCNTYYRDQQFQGVKPYHLSLPRLLLEFISGKRYFERGAVVGAVSTTHTRFQTPVELREALGIPHDRPVNPYLRREPELVEYSKGLQNITVPSQFQVAEAAALFEIWAMDNALHFSPTDEMFLSLYAQSSGNPRDFIWKGILGSFAI
ncbi:uncharacterized protein PHACADRAFT_264802 [Phanerochaete carnosa HHB-10118-sp]|uniref:Small ribosomal subunit protein mS29 n=1 Tax=Phanerochaete carnosa (strain HHB-10118-sp) TaxID=650164 RepID=K5VG64_PHACS|nr:uncharacterized protein PHACADRAFT_264802 [Phanerochaete carnosa HHB-10118-sp]EKM50203.1 hypothetical protein PHACADRAFT_264802 [Phanerochaete carnosa HHB-10118-sp]